jgi:hypothetical protein
MRGLASICLGAVLAIAASAEPAAARWWSPPGPKPPSAACEELGDLIEVRLDAVDSAVAGLKAQLPSASGRERGQIVKQIAVLRARSNFLRATERRIDGGRISARQCERITTVILDKISPS